MTDARAQEAQELFWQVETLRSLRVSHRAIAPKLVRMAQLHEDRARELLNQQCSAGWIDLFAAITAWGEAGREPCARDLLLFGTQLAQGFDGRDSLLDELGHLKSWLTGLRVVPALEDFARRLPPFQREAA